MKPIPLVLVPIACFASQAHADSPFQAITAEVGRVYGGSSAIDVISLGLVQPLSYSPFSFDNWKTSTQVDYQLSNYQGRLRAPQFAQFGNPLSLGAIASIRFERPISDSDVQLYLGAGFGGMYFTNSRFKTGRDIGSKWQFTQQVEAGFRFGETQQHEVGLRVYHISNNNYAKPNQGMDVVKLRYVYYF